MERFAVSKEPLTDALIEDDLFNSLQDYAELLENVVNNRELKEIFENGINRKLNGIF